MEALGVIGFVVAGTERTVTRGEILLMVLAEIPALARSAAAA
jgi:hypothetical protein